MPSCVHLSKLRNRLKARRDAAEGSKITSDCDERSNGCWSFPDDREAAADLPSFHNRLGTARPTAKKRTAKNKKITAEKRTARKGSKAKEGEEMHLMKAADHLGLRMKKEPMVENNGTCSWRCGEERSQLEDDYVLRGRIQCF